ncbi:hypothetical protein ABIE26_003001 [Pedobacter africanus]|uniref:hypothetical protein n=1 Tax=Pedobacter africanus TaxID=151894 RepID=UPI003391E25D
MYKHKSKRIVLGEGETIGHKHVLESAKHINYEKSDHSIRIFLSATGVLTHDEHDRIVIKRGRYRSYNQVEFNPMDGTINRVFD